MHFELHAFERADARGETSLRVTASAPTGARAPSLGIYAREQLQRIGPQAEPGPKPADGLLRAEYRVPTKFLGRGPATFWLELEDGTVIDLPSPADNTADGPSPTSITTDRSSPASASTDRRPPASASTDRRAPASAGTDRRPPANAGRYAPTRTGTRRRRTPKQAPSYTWRLRELMAERDMYATTDLATPLARRGVSLSTTQVYRLVTGTPERLNLKLLAALCDFLDCSPNDLIAVAPRVAEPGGGRRP